MKKIISLFVVMLNIVTISAQINSASEKPDWWNAGKKIAKTDTARTTYPKMLLESIKLDSATVKYIKSSCFLLKQDYCLYDKRKKKLYGYNDKEQFGTTYSLGIKCNGYNIITDQAVQPWKYDENYNEFKSEKLEPILSGSKYLLFDDSETYSYIGSDSIVTAVQTIKDNYIYTAKPFTSLQDGLDLNVSDTCKTGILIWIFNNTGDLETGNITIDFEFVPTKIEMFGSAAITPPHQGKEILGCLLVTKNDNDDTKWYLSGLAASKENTWTLYYPFKGFKITNKKQEVPTVKGRLTEIKPLNNK